MDLSIIVVSYNTRDLTLGCIRSIYKETRDISFEVIVVDNASSDGSADALEAEFPSMRLVRSSSNDGFAAANNQAAEIASGSQLLLLNPDTIVLDGAVQKLVQFARDNRNFAIFGGRTIFEDGSLNPESCWRRPTLWSTLCSATGLSSFLRGSVLFDSESYGHWQRDSVREVDIVSGCFFLISKKLWDELGGFDTEYFMYGEEADLCLRARHMGHKAVIFPGAVIVHHGGRSESVPGDKLVRLLRSKNLLIQRHWRSPMARIGSAMLKFWVLTRRIYWGLRTLLAQKTAIPKAAMYKDVWMRRSEWT